MPTTSVITFRRQNIIRPILYPGSASLIQSIPDNNCLCRAPPTNWHSTYTVMSGSPNSTLIVLGGLILEPDICSSISLLQNQVCRPSTHMEWLSIGRGTSGSPNRVKINLVNSSQQREPYT